MSPTAIVLNCVALLAIIYYPEKPKPYLYLIANLIITDLLVAVIGTSISLVCLTSMRVKCKKWPSCRIARNGS